jgi:dTDP-4-dehydrorhamnose reductase
MKILVIGRTGQLARELARLDWPAGCEIVQLGRSDCDLTDEEKVARAVRSAEPDLVINAAAYTAVDRAELEPEAAMRTNGKGPAILARSCAECRAALIHISTDYVFDGTKAGAYIEGDSVNPLSVYGRTKLAGENAIRENLGEHVILRTSWVFSGYGQNFVKTMLRLGSHNQTIRVVSDQTGAPTSARDLARTIGAIVGSIAQNRGIWGTFHYASEEPTTWYDFARAIFAAQRHAPHLDVQPISAAEYGAPARRPTNSVLDCKRIHDAYGIDRPSWRKALESTLAELEMQGTQP